MKKTKLGQALIHGLESTEKWHKGQMTLRESKEKLPERPGTLSKKEIKSIRETLLKMSQPVFAAYLDVNDATIKSWEQGLSCPKGPALILLRLAKRDPEKFVSIRKEISA